MSKKTKPKKDPKTLEVVREADKTKEEMMAHVALSPTYKSGLLTANFSIVGEIDITECTRVIKDNVKEISSGDMGRVEAMLISQAMALDTLFANLALRSQQNMGQYMNAADKYMKLALKAQSQCRTTLEALAEIKNPRPYIQNNRAEYQQVNNAEQRPKEFSDTNARAGAGGEKLNSTPGLLEDHGNEWLDTGAAGAAGGINQELETVGTVDRAENG